MKKLEKNSHRISKIHLCMNKYNRRKINHSSELGDWKIIYHFKTQLKLWKTNHSFNDFKQKRMALSGLLWVIMSKHHGSLYCLNCLFFRLEQKISNISTLEDTEFHHFLLTQQFYNISMPDFPETVTSKPMNHTISWNNSKISFRCTI